MKLQCDVEVVNRMLPSVGLRSKGRSSRAVLSIGKHADRTLHLLICTAKDRSGAQYKAGSPGETCVVAVLGSALESVCFSAAEGEHREVLHLVRGRGQSHGSAEGASGGHLSE